MTPHLATPPATEVVLSSTYVRGVCEALTAMELDLATFQRRARIDAGWLYATSEWLPLERVDAVLVEAVAMSGDPAFGLHWGERSPMMQFDLGPSLVASAPSLRTALDAIVQLQFLFANRAQLSFVQGGSRSSLGFDLLSASEVGLHVVTELSLVSLLRGFRFLGQERALRRINVGYARPAHGAEYERVFGARLRFDQPRTSIEFASAALEQREGAYNQPLHSMLRAHTDQLSQRARNQLTLREQLADHVRGALPRVLTIVDAAQLMGMSTRSLRRRMTEEDVSYSDVVDGVQRERAMSLIERPELPLKAVASETGFQSMSGFQRAFQRWTGQSPGRSRAR
ncbi:MAG: AraC family transcriptional regulator [Polyangiales bacterium]